MSPNGKLVLVGLISAVLGGMLGAALVWNSQSKAIAELNARVMASDAKEQAALQQVAEAQAKLEAAQTSAAATTAVVPTATTPPVSQTETPTTVLKTVKQFAFIPAAKSAGGLRTLTADYAQLLTGDAAAAAATAHGDESPPPNDYYIVNDNKKLRQLTIAPGTKVKVTTNPDGTSDPSGHAIKLSSWIAYYTSPTDANAAIREAPYWIWVKGTTVTRIEQQYLP